MPKVFISYARVDRPYAVQITDVLNTHEVWYDQHLHSGQDWWDQIQKQISWCEGFIYLLSPASVASEYCHEELNYASQQGKIIIPVLIRHVDKSDMPEALWCRQLVDFTSQLDDGILELHHRLETISDPHYGNLRQWLTTQAEMLYSQPVRPANDATTNNTQPTLSKVIYDQCTTTAGFAFPVTAEQLAQRMNIEVELAEGLLDGTIPVTDISDDFLADIARIIGLEYDVLITLLGKSGEAKPIIKHPYPTDIDIALFLQPIEWCHVPTGSISLSEIDESGTITEKVYEVGPFFISKYPITHKQFQVFLDAPDGYCEPNWWDYSPDAFDWRSQHQPPPIRTFKIAQNSPLTHVTWYEAVAFCNWLSWKVGIDVALPTEQQWRRAAKGNDDTVYPWGDGQSDKISAYVYWNSNVVIDTPTPVERYPEGSSPYSVLDMAGNVWEWCSNMSDTSTNGNSNAHSNSNPSINRRRILRGGSWAFGTSEKHPNVIVSCDLDAATIHQAIGFRVVTNSLRTTGRDTLKQETGTLWGQASSERYKPHLAPCVG